MLQRLGLADALVKSPSIMILDEPTTNIDPIGVVETLDLVQRLAHDEGVCVVLSSHLLHQVQQVCDRIAIFVRGSVAAIGTVADLAQGQQAGALVQIEVGADGPPDAVAETLRSGASPTQIARRYGISTGLLYTWRRLAREGELSLVPVSAPTAEFVPVEIVPEAAVPGEDDIGAGIMVIELPGERRVRVDRHVDAEALRRVLLALGVAR